MAKRTETIKAEIAQYICTFSPEKEGGYSVRCVAFPEIVTHGSTLEDARHNAREALELCLEVYKDKGWKLPSPDAEPRQTIKEWVSVPFVRA